MDERNHNYNDPWDDGVYGTGRTRPPKDRGVMFPLLLILVIFLCGIVTLLSILNVKLFQQLSLQREENLSISFTPDPTEALELLIPETEATMPFAIGEHSLTIDLQDSPEAVENIPQEGGMSLQDIYEKNISSVVSITCGYHNSSSSGTGVVLSGDGYIVTNAHVVEDAHDITIRLTDDREFSASLVGMDMVSDLAVLYIEAQDLTPAEFGDSGMLRVGDSVVAIGDPLGVDLRGTYTDGIISAINRDVDLDGRTMTLIQTNAALNSGNSGGPLINCYGQVIGINTMKIGTFTDAAGVEGIGFAIPSITVKEIVDQIITQGYVSGRPHLGLSGEALPGFYQNYYRMPAGLYITEVDKGSAADLCGIEPGDILISIDDIRISDMDTLHSVLYSHEAGDTITVTIYRAGKTGTATITLQEDKG